MIISERANGSADAVLSEGGGLNVETIFPVATEYILMEEPAALKK